MVFSLVLFYCKYTSGTVLSLWCISYECDRLGQGTQLFYDRNVIGILFRTFSVVCFYCAYPLMSRFDFRQGPKAAHSAHVLQYYYRSTNYFVICFDWYFCKMIFMIYTNV